MIKYILLIFVFYLCSVCFAQEHTSKNDFQICYRIGSKQDHCIKIWFEDSLIFVQRICYSIFNRIKFVESDTNLRCFNKIRKQSILHHYQENDNFLILDERIEINNSQLQELGKIINEIKMFASKNNINEVIINTAGWNHYVIKDKNGTTIIVDWFGYYDRSRDIERALGLKSYLRCPCVEKDLKQRGYNRKNNSFWQRIFSRRYRAIASRDKI